MEKEYPHCLEQIELKPGNSNASCMAWHLRDTSRLREVTVLGKDPYNSGKSFCELMPELLLHLSVHAPNLRSLAWRGTGRDPCNMLRGATLPMLGALRQLESLVLINWGYRMEDLAALTHITRLQNLKVSLPVFPDSRAG